MKEPALLELKQLSFAYEEDRLVLDGLSVRVEAGERIAVLGNNGAGKSTFFLCCNGVLQPREGSICLKGLPIEPKRKSLAKLREAVGLVFQDPDDQILASTVEAELSFGPLNLGLNREETLQRVEQALAEMNLLSCRERPPHCLSGGEKKRVSIAAILAMKPSLMLFDEPTASLDSKNSEQLLETLERLGQSGVALMVSTHDIDFAYAWAKRLLIFCEGRLLADGEPLRLFGDDALLQKAGLRKPMLYALLEKFCAAAGRSIPMDPPKTVETLYAFLKELS